jgi:hypothetical protein
MFLKDALDHIRKDENWLVKEAKISHGAAVKYVRGERVPRPAASERILGAVNRIVSGLISHGDFVDAYNIFQAKDRVRRRDLESRASL